MSAAEKLKALGVEFQEVARGNLVEVVPSDPRVGDRIRYVDPAEVKAARTRVGSALLAALPQIVAVVEAAELGRDRSVLIEEHVSTIEKVAWRVEDARALQGALAALEETLS